MRFLEEAMENSINRRSRQDAQKLSDDCSEIMSYCKRLDSRISKLEKLLKGDEQNDNTP